MTGTGRLVAFLTCVALSLGQVGTCAGWSASAEARMACCTRGACAMHAGSAEHTSDHSTHASSLGQAEADRCCGASEQRDDPAPSPAGAAQLGPLAILPIGAPFAIPLRDRPPVPERPAASRVPVPRHLLLSVLIV